MEHNVSQVQLNIRYLVLLEVLQVTLFLAFRQLTPHATDGSTDLTDRKVWVCCFHLKPNL